MRLKGTERSAILAGEFPEIIRPHENGCPFEVGEVIVIRSQRTEAGPIPLVSITILQKHRRDPKTWQAFYSVKDDRGLYLAKGTGYTRSGRQSIDPDAPVLDEAAQKAYAAQGRLNRARDTEKHREALKQQQRALRSELAQTLNDLEPIAATTLLAKLQREIRGAQS